MVVSGNEITVATRALGIDGDGRTGETSFGLWPAKTNLVVNGGFETDLYGWSALGGSAPVRVADDPKFGGWCCEATNGVAATDCALLTALRDGSVTLFARADGAATLHVALTVGGVAIAEADYAIGAAWGADPIILFYEFGESSALASIEITRTGGGTFWVDGVALYQNVNTDLNVPKHTGGVFAPYIETDRNRPFWEGQPNFVPNGTFAANVTGWTAFGTGATVSHDAANTRLQTVVNTNSGIGVRYEAQFTMLRDVDGALDLKLTAPVGTVFTVEVKHSGTRVAFDSNVVMSTAQKRIILPFTTSNAGSNNLSLYISRNGTAPLTFYVEPTVTVKQSDGTAIATPTGRRDWGVVSLPGRGILRADQMWIAMRVRPGFGSDHYPGGSPRWWRWRDPDAETPDANRLEAFYAVSTDVWGVRRGYPGDHFFGANISADDIPCVLGQEYTLVGQYTPEWVGVSVDGSAWNAYPGSSKKTGGGIPTIEGTTLEIGGTGFAEGSPSGGKDILWMAIGHGELTDADLVTIHGFGDSDPRLRDFPASAQAKVIWTAEDANVLRRPPGQTFAAAERRRSFAPLLGRNRAFTALANGG